MAVWDGPKLTVYDATQYVSGVQQSLAAALGVEKENVRVICRFTGGGFGCKGAQLFRNVAPNRGHWLKVRAVGPRLKRDALGAEVRVVAGGQTRLRLVHSAGSYLSASSPVAHFGLGPAETIDAIRVTWPDGLKEVFPGGAVDRSIELRRGEGKTE